MKSKIKIAIACKLMPLYRLGVFKELSTQNGKFEFTFLGDTVKQGGIEIIPWEYANKLNGGIRWTKTKNYFYKPELLLWQTGIIREILFSDFKVFVFEGAVAHIPIWLFALLCKIRSRKVLFWTHGFRGVDQGLKKWIRILYFKYLSDGILLYGHFSRNLMIKYNFNPDKLFVIYNSLDAKKQFEIYDRVSLESICLKKQEIFSSPSSFTIIFIGRLVKGKKIMDVLRACNEIIKRGVSINCIIIGAGPEIDEIFTYIDHNELKNNVYLTGELYDETEICKYFRMADLMVSPGNVGLNCIHSLAYGVPVLTHNNFIYQNPEFEAIIPNETGIFYEYGNFNDMVEKILSWKDQNRFKSEMVNKCKNMIERLYNPKNQANCIVDAINNIYGQTS